MVLGFVLVARRVGEVGPTGSGERVSVGPGCVTRLKVGVPIDELADCRVVGRLDVGSE